jgi:hypothetical protein
MIGPMSTPGPDSTLTTYTASDGDNLAVQDWHLSYGVRPRALVLLVHGLGEHAGRYDGLARLLSHWGFLVRGYDHYGPWPVRRHAGRPAPAPPAAGRPGRPGGKHPQPQPGPAARPAGPQPGGPGGRRTGGARHRAGRRPGAVLAGAGAAPEPAAEAAAGGRAAGGARPHRRQRAGSALPVARSRGGAGLPRRPAGARPHLGAAGRASSPTRPRWCSPAHRAGRAHPAAVRRRRPHGRPEGSKAFAKRAPRDMVGATASPATTTRSSTSGGAAGVHAACSSGWTPGSEPGR